VPETHVWLEHADPELAQLPLVEHVCGCWPLHWAAPGVHDPVHTPFTHAWLVHAAGVPQVPELLHVCTLLPEHCTAPGVHEPVQAPITHAEPEQAAAVPQVPFD
jgi:hypothetical protein